MNTITPKQIEDPLAKLTYSGNAEKDSLAEQEAIMGAFNDAAENPTGPKKEPNARAKRINGLIKEAGERRRKFTQCGYHVTLVFQSNEQKEAFMAASGWGGFDVSIVDGRVVAKKLGVAIPDENISFVGEMTEKATLNFEPIR